MKIYVGNLSRSMTEEVLRTTFEKFGEVISVKLITDRETGELRGFGFVEMRDAQQAQDAIDGLNQSELDGQRLTVNEARPREERGGSNFRSNRPQRPYSSNGRSSSGSGSRFGGEGRSEGRSSGSGFGGRNRSDRSDRYNNGGWR